MSRLQDNDAIDGAGGTDTLNARVNASADAIIENVEILDLEMLGAAALDGSLITGATNVNVTGDSVLTYKAHDSEAFKVDSAGAGLTVTRTKTDTDADSINVTLGAAKLGTVTVGDKNTTDYETVNLSINGDGSATLSEADSGSNTESFADSGDKIVVDGSGNYTLNIASALLGENSTPGSEADATIDASAHTGKLTVDLGTLTADNVSAKNFSGVDAIALGLESATDILSNVASGTEVVINNASAVSDTLAVKPGGTGSADNVTVTLNHKTAGSSIDIDKLDVRGIETVTINSTGTDSSTVVSNVVDEIDGSSSDTTLIIAGDKKLTVDDGSQAGIDNTWTTVTSTNTAGVDLTIDAGGDITLQGGTPDDRFVFDTVADITEDDSIDGGDGTDTLAISAVIGTDFTTAQAGVIKNMEILEYLGAQDVSSASGVTVDLTKITGINTFKALSDVTTGTSNTLTIKVDDGAKLILDGVEGNSAAEFIIDVKNAADAGTNNTVTLDLAPTTTADDAFDGLTIDNVENFVINMTGDADSGGAHKYTIANIDGAQLTNLTIASTNTGTNTDGTVKASDDLVITAVETTDIDTLDASAMTGAFTFDDVSAFDGGGATITGGSGVNTIVAGTGADVITGGKSGDDLKGNGGNDQIDGGAGNDTIDGEGGADQLTGGDGKDTFVFVGGESTEATMDQITDFAALATDQDFDTLDLVATTVESDIAISSAVDVKAASSETDTDVKAYITDGIIELTGSEASNIDTLAEWIDVAELIATASANSSGSAGAFEYSTVAFEFSGNTYVIQEKSEENGSTETTDAIVELTDVVGIVGLSTDEAADVIHIA